jgi:MFS family permease
MTGPILGKIADAKGPRPLLIIAFIFLLSGYCGIRGIFDAGLGDAEKLNKLLFCLLVLCSFITGVGSHAGMASAMNTTARSFPDRFVSLVRLPILPEHP